ncbi:MAG: polysaccharide deacetylase family protein [Bacteroidota bacterium]|nr:polysaccharide deacetylase family protein [Bacteroidota bacterium]
MKKNIIVFIFLLCFIAACSSNSATKKEDDSSNAISSKTVTQDSVADGPVADLATMLAKKQVPVLCYHHIREPQPGDGEMMKTYSVSPEQFAEHMKALKDSGYETILPDQLYNYLVHGTALPAKPVMLTFDDTDEDQFTIGAKEMGKYGFKGVFFIMTVSINRPHYMTKEQLKQLSDEGNAVEAHTWDHHMVTKYQGDDWEKQLVLPKKKVEEITGKSAKYFAYPFGLWNKAAFPELKKAGYKMAFSLSTKRDPTEPLYTIRRMIVPGQWSTKGMMKAMENTFGLD